MDIEKFINLVYGHKCLWDQSDPSYNLRDFQRRAWREISEEMEMSVDELKKKWRGLRDTFGKELKKNDSKTSGQTSDTEPDSRWPYFKFLLFLRSTMSRRDMKSSVPDTRVMSDGEESANVSVSFDYQPSSPYPDQYCVIDDEPTPKKIFKAPKNIKRRQPEEIFTSLLMMKKEKLKCFQKSANDPDAQFLMSLLPFLKDIPKHRKLVVRTKLQQVLIDEQDAMSSVPCGV